MHDALTTVTHTSYHARDGEAADYARDPYWQQEMVREALYKFVSGGSGGNFHDLRGKSFTIKVGQDGLTVSIIPQEMETTTVPEPTTDASAANG